MAFFSKSLSAASGPAPLSLERLAEVLTSDGVNFAFAEDRTRLGGYFGDHLAEFIPYGQDNEILQLRVHWGRPLGIEDRVQVLDLLNAANSERIWPKSYVDTVDDELYIMCEHSVDYEHGVTDAQILLHVQCAISSSMTIMEQMDDAFPAAVERWRAENPEQAELSADDKDDSDS